MTLTDTVYARKSGGESGDGSMCCEFQALDISARDRCLKRLRENGLSIRQISRLTGVSYYLIQKM